MNHRDPEGSFTLRRLGSADAVDYRALRLVGLKDHPESFGASWEDEVGKPLAWFAERLENNFVLGGWFGSEAPAGVAGLHSPGGKRGHKAMLWGTFVRPDTRRRGFAAALVDRLVEEARGVFEEVTLSVVASNKAAVRLYLGAGFREYGRERRALKIGDAHFDEILMALPLGGRR